MLFQTEVCHVSPNNVAKCYADAFVSAAHTWTEGPVSLRSPDVNYRP